MLYWLAFLKSLFIKLVRRLTCDSNAKKTPVQLSSQKACVTYPMVYGIIIRKQVLHSIRGLMQAYAHGLQRCIHSHRYLDDNAEREDKRGIDIQETMNHGIALRLDIRSRAAYQFAISSHLCILAWAATQRAIEGRSGLAEALIDWQCTSMQFSSQRVCTYCPYYLLPRSRTTHVAYASVSLFIQTAAWQATSIGQIRLCPSLCVTKLLPMAFTNDCSWIL